MAIDIQTVNYIAQLAKLKFTEEETRKLVGELDRILKYVEKLNELDTSNVEPLSHPFEIENILREDKVESSLPVDIALMNAPDRKGNFFKVPRVLK